MQGNFTARHKIIHKLTFRNINLQSSSSCGLLESIQHLRGFASSIRCWNNIISEFEKFRSFPFISFSRFSEILKFETISLFIYFPIFKDVHFSPEKFANIACIILGSLPNNTISWTIFSSSELYRKSHFFVYPAILFGQTSSFRRVYDGSENSNVPLLHDFQFYTFTYNTLKF